MPACAIVVFITIGNISIARNSYSELRKFRLVGWYHAPQGDPPQTRLSTPLEHLNED